MPLGYLATNYTTMCGMPFCLKSALALSLLPPRHLLCWRKLAFSAKMPGSSSTALAIPAAFSLELAALLSDANVPEKFQTFLLEIGCLDVMSFALLASSESTLGSDLIVPSKVELNLMQVVAVKKAWFAARASMPSPGAPAQASSKKPGTMPLGVAEKQLTEWKSAYGHNLSGMRLVGDKLLVFLYEGLVSTPRILEVPSLDNITLKCSLTAQEVKGVNITEGGTILKMAVDIEPCTTHPMYWIRLRAYVTSLCYLMNPIDSSWLSYETAEWFIDTLYWLINFRADGHRPGLKALVQAYTQTFADFAVAVQNDGVQLGDLMREKSQWVHY